MRKVTDHIDKYYQLALQDGLDCPLGRAIAAENRWQMGWLWDGGLNPVPSLVVLRRFRLSTAKRWLAHWRSGGHIRSLRHTQLEWNIRQRGIDKKRRDDYRRWHVC